MDGHRIVNMLVAVTEHAASLPADSPQRGPFLDFLMQLLSNPALQQFIIQLLLSLIPKP